MLCISSCGTGTIVIFALQRRHKYRLPAVKTEFRSCSHSVLFLGFLPATPDEALRTAHCKPAFVSSSQRPHVPIHRGGNQGPESSSHFPQVTQLARDLRTQDHLLVESMLLLATTAVSPKAGSAGESRGRSPELHLPLQPSPPSTVLAHGRRSNG